MVPIDLEIFNSYFFDDSSNINAWKKNY